MILVFCNYISLTVYFKINGHMDSYDLVDFSEKGDVLEHMEILVNIQSIGTVLCHFRKNGRMPVIICKNEKHIVTLYNVIFSNITGILSHLSYIFYYHMRGQQCATEMKCIEKPICLTKLIYKLLFLLKT